MNYEKLIELALKGRSVNQASKDWGIPQPTLDKYVRAVTLPDYQTAKILAQESGIEPGEVLDIMARQEAKRKPRRFFADLGYATAAVMVSVTLFLTPDANAAPAQAFKLQFDNNTNYAKRKRSIKSAIWAWLERLLFGQTGTTTAS